MQIAERTGYEHELFSGNRYRNCTYQRSLYQCMYVGRSVLSMEDIILGITLVVSILKIVVQYKGKQGK